jgi:hypothetical protein
MKSMHARDMGVCPSNKRSRHGISVAPAVYKPPRPTFSLPSFSIPTNIPFLYFQRYGHLQCMSWFSGLFESVKPDLRCLSFCASPISTKTNRTCSLFPVSVQTCIASSNVLGFFLLSSLNSFNKCSEALSSLKRLGFLSLKTILSDEMSGFVLCASPKIEESNDKCSLCKASVLDPRLLVHALGRLLLSKYPPEPPVIWGPFIFQNTRLSFSQNDTERRDVWLCSLRILKICDRKDRWSLCLVSVQNTRMCTYVLGRFLLSKYF